MTSIDLCGKWNLRNRSGTMAVAAVVPGDTHSALAHAGKIVDPYWGENELQLQKLGQEDWIYERQVEIPASLLEEESVTIHFESLDTVAKVFVNGRLAAQSRNMFVPVCAEIKKYLHTGRNTVRVEIQSPERAALAESRKLPYAIPHAQFPIQSAHRNLLRKVQCHSGWDWGPCLMVSGIYGASSIRATSLGRIEHVYTEQKHGKRAVELTVHAEVRSARGGAATLEIEVGGQRVTRPVALQPGLNCVQGKVTIENPKLWWPNGLGAPALYDLTVRIGGDERRKRIGLRTLKVENKEDAHGLSLTFIVNGVPIFCKGASWIPADALPQRQTRAVLDDLLTSAAKAHMNMIRVWGGGQYESDDFYELCDEKGLLVWQDFMFACALYPASSEFLSEARREAEYQIKRLTDHPSLALWCGNNENLGFLNWFPEAKANRDRYIVDYDRLNEGVLGKAVLELDPQRSFWPSSPCGGHGDYSDCWHNDARGDMHFWSVWHEGKPFEAYTEIKPRFCSEFGYQSFPSLDTIRRYARPEHFNVSAPVMEFHQRNPGGNARITENFARYFRFPEGFENFVYLSQVQQALAIKTAVEYWRSLRPICMGALYWQLNDTWPVCSWASLEHGGKWKMLHYAARHFFAPHLISVHRTKAGRIEIHGSNDTLKAATASVTIRVMDLAGNVRKRIAFRAKLPANGSARIKDYAVSQLVADEAAEFLAIEMKVGRDIVRNDYFFTVFKKLELQKPQLKTTIRKGAGNTFAVTIASRKPAFYVMLQAEGIEGEFDDNGLTILPGEPRVLTFTPKKPVALDRFKRSLKICDLHGSSGMVS